MKTRIVVSPRSLRWQLRREDRDVRARRRLAQRCDDAVAGHGCRLKRKKHRPTRWRVAEPPDLLHCAFRGRAEPCRGADYGCQRPAADAEHAQIVLGEIDFVSAVERTLSPKRIADFPDRPTGESAFTAVADAPVGKRRLFDEATFREQPVENRTEERRGKLAGQDCIVASLTQPRQEPQNRLGHSSVRSVRSASSPAPHAVYGGTARRPGAVA